jgi:hypothetical protein
VDPQEPRPQPCQRVAGFPLGGFLSLTLMAGSAIVFLPRSIGVDSLAQVALPTSLALGKLGLAAIIVGSFACTFGAPRTIPWSAVTAVEEERIHVRLTQA